MNRPAARLCVRRGLHRGARGDLLPKQALVLGSDDACDIRLLDAGVAARHVELQLRRQRLRLRALQAGVRVRGRELRPGARASVRGGEGFSVATVLLRYQAAPRPRTGALGVLHRFGRGARRMRPAHGLAAAAFGCIALALWPAARPALRVGIDPRAWPGVRQWTDPGNGAALYTGHVEDETALALLRAQWQRDGVPGRFRVAARTQVARRLEELAARHFAVSRVIELQPGRYRVVTAGPAVFLDAAAWDTGALARDMRAQVRGVDNVEFAEDPGLLDPGARLPLSAPAWTLVSTPRGRWISDGSARRYFEGARLPDGRVLGLESCAVRIVDAEHGRILHFRADPGHVPCP